MSFRATLALGVIAAALGIYVYLVEIRGERERQEAETAAKRLLALEGDQITALELPLAGGGRAKLVRGGEGDPDGWALEMPVAFPADANVVANLLSNLASLESESVIEDLPEDLAPFGLGEERRAVRVWAGEGEPSVLYLGGRAPLGSLLYVALEGRGTELFTVPLGPASALEPRLRELRNKRVVGFEVSDVQRLRVQEHGSLVALVERVESEDEAEDEGWRVVEPREDRADAERVRRVLQDLVFARATDFVDEPGALEEYGLDAPELELSVGARQGMERILIGRVQDKGFVRVNDQRVIYETSDRVLMNVPRSLFAYRYKRVLKVDADRVRRIELDFPRDGVSHALVRKNGTWAAEDAELEVKSLSVEDVLYAIEDLQATGIVEPAAAAAGLGLDPPRVRVRALGASGAELGWLELGDPAPEVGLPARSSEHDRIWRVLNDVGADIPLGLEAFQRNFVEAEPEPAEGEGEDESSPEEPETSSPAVSAP
jgi:hypothetical protein